MKKEAKTENILKNIRVVHDWPKRGVDFLDITTVLGNAELFKMTIDEMAKLIKKAEVDKIIGIDARGFIFASALAYKLNKSMNIARKKGKLPGKTVGCKYGLEYGEAELELLEDAVSKGEKVLIVDDVLATGGTAEAVAEIVKKLGGEVSGFLFFIEIGFLKGNERLKDHKVYSFIKK